MTSRALGARDGVLSVLDPACGDGGLLLAFSQSVPAPIRKHLVLTGYETDPAALAKAEDALSTAGVKAVVLHGQDFLSVEGGHFDAVIANPPYVRTQILGAKRAQELAAKFRLSGRVDLYQAFALAMASLLKPGGVLGLLTSNRFLTVKSGAALRRLLRSEFALEAIYDLGDTKLFSAAVLPAVVVAKKLRTDAPPRCVFERVYEQRNGAAAGTGAHTYPSILTALQERRCQGTIRTPKGVYSIERGLLSVGGGGAWSLSTPAGDEWLRTVHAQRASTFSDVGKVRVGIKTTADEVFIRNDWDDLPDALRPEEELLRPLITHCDAGRWLPASRPRPRRVLYPHTVRDGKRASIDLDRYPRARRYLKTHEARLRQRRYVLDAGRRWYEIWVAHNPEDWKKARIVFPDISELPRFFLDRTGAVVNGDCYWITLREGMEVDWLLLMLAVACSTFSTRYYDAVYHNKLYSGRRRFMTQYVGGFPLPALDGPCGKKIVEQVSRLVTEGNPSAAVEEQIDRLVWEAFGLAGGNA